MDKNILDEGLFPEQDSKGLSKTKMYLVRYLVCGYYGAVFLNPIFRSSNPIDVFLITLYSPIVWLFIWFVYYNLRQAFNERKPKPKPYFKTLTTILFIACVSFYIFSHIIEIYEMVQSASINMNTLTRIILIVLLFLILRKEVVYLMFNLKKSK